MEDGGGGKRKEEKGREGGRKREGGLTAPHFGNVFLIKVWPPALPGHPCFSLTQTFFFLLCLYFTLGNLRVC